MVWLTRRQEVIKARGTSQKLINRTNNRKTDYTIHMFVLSLIQLG